MWPWYDSTRAYDLLDIEVLRTWRRRRVNLGTAPSAEEKLVWKVRLRALLGSHLASATSKSIVEQQMGF